MEHQRADDGAERDAGADRKIDPTRHDDDELPDCEHRYDGGLRQHVAQVAGQQKQRRQRADDDDHQDQDQQGPDPQHAEGNRKPPQLCRRHAPHFGVVAGLRGRRTGFRHRHFVCSPWGQRSCHGKAATIAMTAVWARMLPMLMGLEMADTPPAAEPPARGARSISASSRPTIVTAVSTPLCFL